MLILSTVFLVQSVLICLFGLIILIVLIAMYK